jgi:hypothetical protein
MADVDWAARSEAAERVFMEAGNRAALETDFGFCAYGTASGMPWFYWFATREDMLEALRGHALFLNPSLGMDVDTAQLALERTIATADPADLETLRRNLNQHLIGASTLTWMGSFKDLCEGDHQTAQDVRAAFRDELDEPIGNKIAPISLGELHGFVVVTVFNPRQQRRWQCDRQEACPPAFEAILADRAVL